MRLLATPLHRPNVVITAKQISLGLTTDRMNILCFLPCLILVCCIIVFISVFITRATLWSCACVCLSLSVSSRCSIERGGQIDIVSGKGASFDPSYTV